MIDSFTATWPGEDKSESLATSSSPEPTFVYDSCTSQREINLWGLTLLTRIQSVLEVSENCYTDA